MRKIEFERLSDLLINFWRVNPKLAHFLLQILRAIYPQRASAFWLIGQSSHMEVSWNNLALIETLENYARYIIPLKWSLVCGMDEIFMGQFFGIFNFLFIFLLQTGRFLLGSMHVALDFQILTGNLFNIRSPGQINTTILCVLNNFNFLWLI